jgi:hypothetical protein
MPGLVPGIHVFATPKQEETWMADKPGHDGEWIKPPREPEMLVAILVRL